jgi:hypothetical protein
VLAFLLSFKLLPSFSRFVVCLQTCFSFFLSFFFLSERESSEGLHRTSSEEVEIVILEEKKLPLRQSFFLFFFFFLRWAGSVCFCCSIGFFFAPAVEDAFFEQVTIAKQEELLRDGRYGRSFFLSCLQHNHDNDAVVQPEICCRTRQSVCEDNLRSPAHVHLSMIL